MTDAINQPVQRRRREANTADFPIDQMPSINLDASQDVDRDRVVIADATALQDEFAKALAFAEEPVDILIHPPASERNPPQWVPCWVNGRGAELFLNGQWVACGYLPVNTPLTTKRKYVEVLIRSKQTTYQTAHVAPEDAKSTHVDNFAVPQTNLANQVTIQYDANPLGREWMQRLVRERE
jgi:hypothetical protein